MALSNDTELQRLRDLAMWATNRQWLSRVIVAAIQEQIARHGFERESLTGGASKRAAHRIEGELRRILRED